MGCICLVTLTCSAGYAVVDLPLEFEPTRRLAARSADVRGTREAGKDYLDSLRGTREAGKDQLDSLRGTREAGKPFEAGKNHLDSLGSTREAV